MHGSVLKRLGRANEFKASRLERKYAGLIGTAADAMQLVKPGDSIFIGTGCGRQYLSELMAFGAYIRFNIIHFLTVGPHVHEREFRDKFKSTASSSPTACAKHQRPAPIIRRSSCRRFRRNSETGRIPLDIAFISVTPPDANGLCSLGISVDIVKSAAANAKYVVAGSTPTCPAP